MSDLQEHITSVRATLDELEAALHAVDTARARYHEVAGGLAERLGAPRLPELLQLPAPAEATIVPPAKPKASRPTTPPPGCVARPRRGTKPKRTERPVRERPASATAPAPGTEACEWHSRRSRCRTPVKLVVKCPQCDWSCSRCAAHPAKSAAHILGAHVHRAHGRAKRTPPAHAPRKASGRADQKRRPAAAPAAAPLTRRELIAQRACAIAPPAARPAGQSAIPLRRGRAVRRCSNCGEPGHRAPGCPRPPGDPDGAGAQRPAAAALDVAGLAELDSGHDAVPRAARYGVEE